MGQPHGKQTKPKRAPHEFRGLIPGFRATTFAKAFTLNAIAAALTTGVTIGASLAIDDWQREQEKPLSRGARAGIYMLIAFVAAFASYGLLYVLFGFGKGQFA